MLTYCPTTSWAEKPFQTDQTSESNVTPTTAKLAVEDGTVFDGLSFGAPGETAGELVFNTSMTGYQEILTDPSYRGQIVTMTYPLIGNYGVNTEDVESRKPFVEGFVVRECTKTPSNWRAAKSLPEYLQENDIVAIEGLDTRAITRKLRIKGAMTAIISTDDLDNDSLVKKAREFPKLAGRDLVKDIVMDGPMRWNEQGNYNVVVLDCGVKYNIMRKLAEHDCRVTAVPAQTPAGEILAMKPDGVLLSNGPGDPEPVSYVIQTVRDLKDKVPIFGICLGHQMLGLALGGETYKLKFGHRGANHPVKDMRTGKVAITVQNHGFCVDSDSLPPAAVEVTHLNLNDGTLEGLRHRRLPMFSVQFHPEASPGPHDAHYLFRRFVDLMRERHA